MFIQVRKYSTLTGLAHHKGTQMRIWKSYAVLAKHVSVSPLKDTSSLIDCENLHVYLHRKVSIFYFIVYTLFHSAIRKLCIPSKVGVNFGFWASKLLRNSWFGFFYQILKSDLDLFKVFGSFFIIKIRISLIQN